MEAVNVILRDVEDEYKEIYKKYFRTIQTRINRGRLRTVYHFLVTGNYSRNIAKDHISSMDFQLNIQNAYKVNVAFGFILRNIRTQELRFFHPSNNSMLYELPTVVSNRNDILRLLNDLENEDARAYAMAHRPSTEWRMEKIVCIRFDVYKVITRPP